MNSNSNFGQRDIYALGMLFIRILTGNLNPKKNEIKLLDEIEEQYSAKLADLLERNDFRSRDGKTRCEHCI